MKTNEHSIEEEATWLLEYEVPELKELTLGVAFGGNMELGGSGDFSISADDESEEENGTFSLDD